MQQEDTPVPSRRRVLRSVGAGLTAIGVSSTAVSASTNSEDCEGCGNSKVLGENEKYKVIKSSQRGREFLVRVDKENKRVSYEPVVESGLQTLTEEQLFSDDAIQPNGNHKEIIEDYNGFVRNPNDCNGHVYNQHYISGISIETGSSLEDYPSGALGAATCGVAAGAVTGPAGAALAGIACHSFQFFFLSAIDMSGHTLSIAAWDCHTGWLNEEGVCTGAANHWTDDRTDFHQSNKIPGPHLGVGKGITEWLD